MQSLEKSVTLAAVRSLLQDTLAVLTPDEATEHAAHLTRLRHALGDYAETLQPPAATGARALGSASLRRHLDALPPRALQCIVRHLSARPRSLRWEQFVTAEEAEAQYCGAGALTLAFRTAFPAVEIGADEPRKRPRGPPAPFPLRPAGALGAAPAAGGAGAGAGADADVADATPFAMPLRARTWAAGAVRVLSSAGPGLRRVRFVADAGAAEPAPHLLSWIEPFRGQCGGVLALEVGGLSARFLGLVLAARAGGLESLALDFSCCGAAHLDAVAAHCRGLRCLSLAAVRAPGARLWDALGPALEELTVSFMNMPPPKPPATALSNPVAAAVRAVRERCTALRRIAVHVFPPNVAGEVQRWVRTRGVALEFLLCDFACMSPSMRRSIADGCPNAVFELSGFARPGMVCDLRFRVQRLRFNGAVVEEFDAERLSSNCQMLRELSIVEGGWQTAVLLSTLLHVPKPNLATLRLSVSKDCVEQVFRQLALLTTTIEYLDIVLPALHLASLEGFLVANPRLCKFELELSKKAVTVSPGAVAEAIGLFTKHSPALRELIMTRPAKGYASDELVTAADVAMIANACVPFRSRQTLVHVFGIDYL